MSPLHCPGCRCHARAARTGRPRLVRLTLNLSSPTYERAALEADRRGMTVAEWSTEALEVLLVELAGNGTPVRTARRAPLRE